MGMELDIQRNIVRWCVCKIWWGNEAGRVRWWWFSSSVSHSYRNNRLCRGLSKSYGVSNGVFGRGRNMRNMGCNHRDR